MEDKIENKDNTEELFKKRKEKFVKALNIKYSHLFYGILGFLVFLSIYIRTGNLSKLKDITTNSWTLGPDLDPFLFLRWTKEIMVNGFLSPIDTMRYVPLGYNTSGEMKFLSYLIYWFHQSLAKLGLSDNVTYSANIFPVFAFALTTIAFFLFTRKIFYKESNLIRNSIALVSTSFFITIPSLLPRTIAGIPEKESIAFFFMFLAFYFFIESFTSKTVKKGIIYSVFAGISTACMALIWGGVIFIFLTISATAFLYFLIGNFNKNKFIYYSAWMFSSFMLMMPFSTRYSLSNLIVSFSTGSVIAMWIIIGISLFISNNQVVKKIINKTKLPKEIALTLIIGVFIVIFISLILGPSFITGEIEGIKNSLIQPSESRFSFTVAENKQPYYSEDWKQSFGPEISRIPLFFWMFFIGAVFLFSNMISGLNKKEKYILNSGYTFFLFAIIFSRYSPNSIFNGLNLISILFYFSGWFIFLISFGNIYFKKHKIKEEGVFKEFNFSYLLYFLILTLGIIGARGAIRLIMVLGAIAPISVGFLIVKTINNSFNEKEETKKAIFGLLTIIILLSSIITLYSYYNSSVSTSEYFAPGPYQWQWQNAMSWVRENTPKDAVFSHWWDYGYWVQSIGERATVLDGGNAIVYWNHLMGRHVLTGSDERKALDFLYTHNTTHLLIDSTDIGKYTAFSSIGADENYDRYSWIPTFLMDESQTLETKNETNYIYVGGVPTDEDIIWNEKGEEIFLPKKKTMLVGIILKKINNNTQISQPSAIFAYSGKQYNIPLRYIYISNTKENIDFKQGLNAGIFIFPTINGIQNNNVNLNYFGAILYLSNRTIDSGVGRLYLMDKKSDYIKLVHTESDLFVDSLKKQTNINLSEFIYYQGFRGPIKIWEITYPSNIQSNPEFLKLDYPNESLRIAKPGEY